MKIKLFKSFNESKDDIDSICRKYDIENYTINDDGSIDVNGNVILNKKQLTKLPLKFRNVSGYFYCNDNQLVSLEGAPKKVGGDFVCSYNKLINLEGGPQSVLGNFICIENQLITLQGAPKSVGGQFFSRDNQLKSLEYASDIKGNLYFAGNPINKWWDMVNNKSKTNFELFKDFNLHTDDPDEINLEKITMINND